MTNIHIFYHVYQHADWEYLYQNQMHSLFVSGLYKHVKSINVGVVGNRLLPFVTDKTQVRYYTENKEEAHTLKLVRDFCMSSCEEAQILYFHTKGISHINSAKLCSYSWRLMMEYFAIHKWKECVDYLKKYDAVGTNWTIDTHLGKKPHFSGNIWWAKSSYINRLDHSYLDTNHRLDREFWIGSNYFVNNPKIKDIHNSGMNTVYGARHMSEIYSEINYIC